VKRIFLAIALIVIALVASQPYQSAHGKQQSAAAAPAGGEFGNYEAITAAELKEYLYYVASDEMEGRDTPSRGLDMTAKFIAEKLSRWGVKPGGTDNSFLQKFALTSRRVLPEQTTASLNGQDLKLGEDFIAVPFAGQASGPIVYVPYDLIKSKNANQELDLKGKIMLVAEENAKGGASRQGGRGRSSVDYDSLDRYGRAHGAKGVIILPGASTLASWDQRYKTSVNPFRLTIERPQQSSNLPLIFVSEKTAAALLQGEKVDFEGIKKQMNGGEQGESFALSPAKQIGFNVAAKAESMLTQNVVGVIEGSDPVLKNEYVAVGAHYDHVGMRQSGDGDRIFNGADDDGSGTVATLTIAHALATSPQRPKRSVIFVWHAGEEKGLWGSEFFTDNPAVPINQIITQLNIDMIGRSKKEGDTNPANKDLTGPNAIYVIGSKMMSTELGNLSEEVNNAFLKLDFNYKYDAPNDPERFFYRSDHFNYARKGIPIIFYFDGVHEDYHRPSDTADKIDYQKMEKVARTIYAMMWKLANAPSRPKVDKPLPPQLTN
jgi:Zn-dependent M28 family amino/carboxypeptidase